jgi:hypothetical protein
MAKILEDDRERWAPPLGFTVETAFTLFQERIIPLLTAIVAQTGAGLETLKEVSRLSSGVIDQFAARVEAGFSGAFHLGRICGGPSEGSDRASQARLQLPPIYIQPWVPREFFIEDWYVDSRSIGSEYGAELARLVEHEILSHMARIAEKLSFSGFQERFKSRKEDLVLISGPMGLDYRSVWRNEFHLKFSSPEIREASGPEHTGEMRIGDNIIQVYTILSPIWLPFQEDAVLVMPRSMLGNISAVGGPPDKAEGMAWEGNGRDIGRIGRKAWLGLRKPADADIEKFAEETPFWLQQNVKESGGSVEHWLKTHLVLWLRTTVTWSYPTPATIFLVTPD